MLKYACGKEVMVGDTVLRFDSNGGVLAVGEYVVKTIQHLRHYITLDGEGDSRNFSTEYFNLISRKGETTMKTKQFTKADLKTGMRLVFSEGVTGIVMLCAGITSNHDIISYIKRDVIAGYDYLEENLDSTSAYGELVKVLQPKCETYLLNVQAECKVIWEREAPKSEEQIAYEEAVEATEAARKAYELAQKKLEALNPSKK